MGSDVKVKKIALEVKPESQVSAAHLEAKMGREGKGQKYPKGC